MKRFIHNLWAVTLIIVLSLSFVGCNNDDEYVFNISRLDGVWAAHIANDLTDGIYDNFETIKQVIEIQQDKLTIYSTSNEDGYKLKDKYLSCSQDDLIPTLTYDLRVNADSCFIYADGVKKGHIHTIDDELFICYNSSNKKEVYKTLKGFTPQTLIFYFAGTDLTFYFYKNVSAIKDALRENIKGGSRVMLFFQQSEKNSAEIIELTYNNGLCEEQKLAKYDLPEYMDAEYLSFYLNEIMRLAPAGSYSLIIGSHGLGWIPIGAKPNGPTSSLRSISEEDSFWQQTGDITTRFIGEESNLQNAFNISTLSEALSLTGQQMEYILFDACFMANVESMYELRNNTKYIVGSVCEIMGDGFPYTKIMPHLLKNQGTSYDLDLVCQEFNQHYLKNKGYSGSISLINCSELDALAQQMKRVNQGATLNYTLSDIQFYEGQSRHVFFDLGDYVNHFCGDEALKADFKTQLEKTVIKRYTLDKFYSAYGSFGGGTYKIDVDAYSGLNTSAPAEVYQYYYVQTDWYKATH